MNQQSEIPLGKTTTLSPREEWKKLHNVRTLMNPRRNARPRWHAWVHGDMITRYGDTEEQALWALCTYLKVAPWRASI